MSGRKRTVQVKFYVTEEEKKLIEEKMKLVPTSNMAAYLRKIAIDVVSSFGCSYETADIEFGYYGLTMNFEQYVLVGSTVRSYLAWLKDTGKLDVEFENNMLLWKQK